MEIDLDVPEVIRDEKRPGGRGRPKKVIDPEFLRTAMDPKKHTLRAKLARDLGISSKTLKKRLDEASISYGDTDISDDALDNIVRAFRESKPQVGLSYVVGHVREQGLRIPTRRIRMSMLRTGGLASVFRNPTRIPRRQYRVPRPNALWHLDGHHKLILWGIVIHGVIDGYCRTVCQ
jgi:hypothetical protein